MTSSPWNSSSGSGPDLPCRLSRRRVLDASPRSACARSGPRWAGGLLTGLLALAGCGDGDGTAAPAVPDSAATLRVPVPGDQKVPAAGGGERGPAAERRFFRWLPREALVAMQLPQLDRTRLALRETALYRAFSELQLGSLRGKLDELNAMLVSRLQEQWLPGVDLDSLLDCFGGDVVFAVVGINPTLILQGRQAMPLSLALYAELDGNAPLVGQAVRALADRFGGSKDFTAADEGSERFEFQLPQVFVEVLVTRNALAVAVTPPGMGDALAGWMNLDAANSFSSSAVVKSAQPLGTPEKTVVEAFVNLGPVWNMVKMFAPPEAQKVLAATGLTGIEGLSFASTIEGDGFRERVALHSPGGRDIVSRLVGGATLDAGFSRWVPLDPEATALFAMDLAHVEREVRQCLPEAARREMDAGLQQLQAMAGIDWRKDVVENFGPQFLVVSGGSPMFLSDQWQGTLKNGKFEVMLGVQVRNMERTRRLMDQWMQSTGLSGLVRVQHAAGKDYYSLPVPAPAGMRIDLEPSWALSDGCLLLATNPLLVSKSLMAAELQGKAAPRVLQDALKDLPDGTWMASYTDVAAQFQGMTQGIRGVLESVPGFPLAELPGQEAVNAFAGKLGHSLSLGRRVPAGLVGETTSTVGSFLGGAGATTAVVAAIAIPNLMSARNQANESTAMHTLRRIAAAQEQYRAGRLSDVDRDGLGEYGYFRQIAGGTLGGLDPDFQGVENGCVTYRGYCYRVDLPDAAGRPCPEAASGGGSVAYSPDGAESGFAVYCWPLAVGETGTRAFVIDESGEVFSTANDGPYQGYSGMLRTPHGDAAFLLENSNRERGQRSVRRGRDGSLWLRED